jgi:transcriptional regulator of heat shock response
MTLEDLSQATFYQMQNYSQLIIDFVDEVEQDLHELTEEQKGAKRYQIQNVLSVIDKERTHDVEALRSLLVILL